MVKRDDGQGYNIMLEIDDRTHSYQVPENVGEAAMLAAQSAVIDVLVQRRFGLND